jgi:hypothetical protein
MRAKASTNPITDMTHRFDIESSLFANLTNDGLYGRFPGFECSARQLPPKKIASNRQ